MGKIHLTIILQIYKQFTRIRNPKLISTLLENASIITNIITYDCRFTIKMTVLMHANACTAMFVATQKLLGTSKDGGPVVITL